MTTEPNELLRELVDMLEGPIDGMAHGLLAEKCKAVRAYLAVPPQPPEPGSGLADRVQKARDEMATWTPERRSNCRLEGPDGVPPQPPGTVSIGDYIAEQEKDPERKRQLDEARVEIRKRFAKLDSVPPQPVPPREPTQLMAATAYTMRNAGETDPLQFWRAMWDAAPKGEPIERLARVPQQPVPPREPTPEQYAIAWKRHGVHRAVALAMWQLFMLDAAPKGEPADKKKDADYEA